MGKGRETWVLQKSKNRAVISSRKDVGVERPRRKKGCVGGKGGGEKILAEQNLSHQGKKGAFFGK